MKTLINIYFWRFLVPLIGGMLFVSCSESGNVELSSIEFTCGNGRIEKGEVCDGPELGSLLCSDFLINNSSDVYFHGGVLLCNEDCLSYKTSACFGYCGDGNADLDFGEVCDRDNIGGKTCRDINLPDDPFRKYYNGELLCLSDCNGLDDSSCFGYCGDGVLDIEEGEECDGVLESPESCRVVESPGFGNFYTRFLECDDNCRISDAACVQFCGDGVIDFNENEECDGESLGGVTCSDLGSPGTSSFYGGILSCTDNCLFDTNYCTGFCGDGLLDITNEMCDADIFRDDCRSLGFYEGTLNCSSDCQSQDESQCFGYCGDSICQNGEILRDDCPDDCMGCGDGVCSAGQDTTSCCFDCPVISVNVAFKNSSCSTETVLAVDSCDTSQYYYLSEGESVSNFHLQDGNCIVFDWDALDRCDLTTFEVSSSKGSVCYFREGQCPPESYCIRGCHENIINTLDRCPVVDAAISYSWNDLSLCGINEHVLSSTCVPCAQGNFNEAGDDPLGGDTLCGGDACDLALGVSCQDFEQAYIKSSNTDLGNQFGYSVALSGDTLAVGAFQESSNATGINGNQSDNSEPKSGAVYVFTRTGTTWTQQAYIKSSNTDAFDQFGWSIALSGDTLAVGAFQESSNAIGINGNQSDNSALNSGAVYVFIRTGTTWTQQAYIKSSNTDLGNQFGYSVALSGDTLAVGAIWENSGATGINGNQSDNSALLSGAVYVFTRTGTTWTQQAYIKASSTNPYDHFGNSVALSGNTLAVGAYFEDSNATGINGNQSDYSANESGAVYIFTRTGTTWTQQAYIKASNTNVDDQFGWSVALSGDTLAVGANGEDSNAIGINGNQVDNSALNSGAVYVFIRTGTTWTQQAYIKSSNTDLGNQFGYSVALSGDTLAVGANGEDSSAIGINGNQVDNSALNSGAVYVFIRTGTTWTQQAYIKSSNTDAGDHFGDSVALSGDIFAVGASDEDSNATGINGNQSDNSALNSGAVYIRKVLP